VKAARPEIDIPQLFTADYIGSGDSFRAAALLIIAERIDAELGAAPPGHRLRRSRSMTVERPSDNLVSDTAGATFGGPQVVGAGSVPERTAGMVGSRTRCRRPSTVDQSC